jgi:hypothetical protein
MHGELPRLVSLAMAPKHEHPSTRTRPISNRTGDQACHCRLRHLAHHQAIRGRRVSDLDLIRTVRQATLQLPRHEDLVRLRWDPFHRRQWDGRMNQLRFLPLLSHRPRQDLLQRMACMSIPANRLLAITKTLLRSQSQRVSRQCRGRR